MEVESNVGGKVSVDVTVVTPTVGDSAARLACLLHELQKFTSIPYRHIVSDDGTENDMLVGMQKGVCLSLGAEHVSNVGDSGLAENLTHLCKLVDTEWVFIIEDGIRPGKGWLEYSVSAIERLRRTEVEGWSCAIVGFVHIEDYLLVLGNAVPSKYGSLPWLNRQVPPWERQKEFLSDWNTGNISRHSLSLVIRNKLRCGYSGLLSDHPFLLTKAGLCSGLLNRESNRDAEGSGRPPDVPQMTCQPSGLIAIHMPFLKSVNYFRRKCTYYEAHLSIVAAKQKKFAVLTDGPPFLHTASTGFSSPYCHTTPKSDQELSAAFMEDFGVTNDKAATVFDRIVPFPLQNKINAAIEEQWTNDS